jgi:hypothetical protein
MQGASEVFALAGDYLRRDRLRAANCEPAFMPAVAKAQRRASL